MRRLGVGVLEKVLQFFHVLFSILDGKSRPNAVLEVPQLSTGCLSTCELKGVNPYDSFKDILKKLSNTWPASQINDLLPNRWKELNTPSTDE